MLESSPYYEKCFSIRCIGTQVMGCLEADFLSPRAIQFLSDVSETVLRPEKPHIFSASRHQRTLESIPGRSGLARRRRCRYFACILKQLPALQRDRHVAVVPHEVVEIQQ